MEDSNQQTRTSIDRSESTAAKLRAIREKADQNLEAHLKRLSDIEAEVDRRVAEFVESYQNEAAGAAEARSQSDQEQLTAQAAQLAEFEERVANLQASFDEQLAEHIGRAENDASKIAKLESELSKRAVAESNDSIARSELADRCAALEAELAQQQVSYEQLAGEACQTCANTSATLAAAEKSVLELKERIAELDGENQSLAESLAESEEAQAALAAELETAKSQVRELQEAAESLEEVGPLQQKFDLALADVQKVKRENASLREELASRPEANEQESAELISMRAERDALVSRIEELESAAPQLDDAELQQQLTDLQQRFELAVEDVRLHKQEAAKLREQLAEVSAGASPSISSADEGVFDWQAQKERLIMMLDEEASLANPTPERQGERATVEGTIKVTDKIVAEKDREIEELQQQLEAAGNSSNGEGAHAQAVLDVDELVQAEVARLKELQTEWESKVRQSELEISVERAKLARDRAQLEERLAAGTAAESNSPAEEPASDAKPKRRWLAALGLKEDQDEDDS